MSAESPVLVLLHAFPVDARIFDPVRDALSGATRLLTPDLAGFGGSPLPAQPPSIDALADEVVRTLDDLGIASAVIGGVSMGGYVALAFARRHPSRLRGLVLASTRAGADAPAGRERRERIAKTVLEEGSVRVVREEVAPGLLGRTTQSARPDVVAQLGRLVDDAPVGAVAWAQ